MYVIFFCTDSCQKNQKKKCTKTTDFVDNCSLAKLTGNNTNSKGKSVLNFHLKKKQKKNTFSICQDIFNFSFSGRCNSQHFLLIVSFKQSKNYPQSSIIHIWWSFLRSFRKHFFPTSNPSPIIEARNEFPNH